MFALPLALSAALCWSAHDVVARSYAERVGPFRMAFGVGAGGRGRAAAHCAVARRDLAGRPLWALGYAVALGVVYAFALGGLLKAFSLAPVSIVGPMTAGYPALVVLWGLYPRTRADPCRGMVRPCAGACMVQSLSVPAAATRRDAEAMSKGQVLLIALLAIDCRQSRFFLRRRAGANGGREHG